MRESVVKRIGAAAAAIAFAAALAPGSALAATALTGEVQLNQATTGFQENPEISMLPNGQFSAVWEDQNTADSIARSFNASLAPLGNEFPAHPIAQGSQDNPVVALDSAGGLKTAWDAVNGPALGDGEADRGVLFSRGPSTGPTVGGGVVNTTVALNQDSPAIAARPGGEFAVAWESFSAVAGALDDVYARRYDAAGVPVDGTEVQINAGVAPVAADQDQPAISAAGDSGNYVIGFENPDGGGDDGVFARFFKSDGSVVGPTSVPAGNIPLNATVAGDQFGVDVASDPDGKFTAVWTGPDGTGNGIYARRFGFPSGAPVGAMPDKPVNQVTAGGDSLPAVATDGSGNYVVAWYRGANVFARTFDSDLNPTNDEIQVNTTATPLCGCSPLGVAMDANKNFVVIWEADAPGGAVDDEIFARRFSTATLPPDNPGGGPSDPGNGQQPPPLTCGGKIVTIPGTEAAETLKGTTGPDVIAGLGGNDKITGGNGNDTICGGAGNDKINGSAGKDKLFGEAGKDKLNGSGGKGDVCNGGPGKDKGTGSCEKAPSA